MRPLTSRKLRILLIAAAACAAVVLVWWGVARHSQDELARARVAALARAHKRKPDPLDPAVNAYNKGRYKDAEAAAMRIIKSSSGSKDPAKRRRAVEARYVTAFAAARQKNFRVARERFSVLRQEVGKLHDKGKQAAPPGVAPTTFEEDATL